MSTPSWDLSYLESVERRLRDLTSRIEKLEKTIKSIASSVLDAPEVSSPAKRRR